MIQATELLLQAHSAQCGRRAAACRVDGVESWLPHGPGSRRPGDAQRVVRPPVTHLLSNGRYTRDADGGRGRLQPLARSFGYLRWREDAPRRSWPFVLLRDNDDGRVWCAGAWIPGSDDVGEDNEVLFVEDRAAFHRRDGTADHHARRTGVSGEDDGEVRGARPTVVARRRVEITLTSYAGLALGSRRRTSRIRHSPAVRPDRVSGRVWCADRHPPAPARKPIREIWAAHFAVVEGDVCADPQCRIDRAALPGAGSDHHDSERCAGRRSVSNGRQARCWTPFFPAAAVCASRPAVWPAWRSGPSGGVACRTARSDR